MLTTQRPPVTSSLSHSHSVLHGRASHAARCASPMKRRRLSSAARESAYVAVASGNSDNGSGNGLHSHSRSSSHGHGHVRSHSCCSGVSLVPRRVGGSGSGFGPSASASATASSGRRRFAWHSRTSVSDAVLVSHVFPFFSVHSLAQQRVVSKVWSKHIDEALRLLRTVDTNDHDELFDDDTPFSVRAAHELRVLKLVRLRCTHLRYLAVRIYDAECLDTVVEILSVPRRFEVLRLLATQDGDVDGTRLVRALCQHQRHVRVLAFFREEMSYSLPNWVFDAGTLKLIGDRLPALEVLYIQANKEKVNHAEVSNILTQCRKLRVLALVMMRFNALGAFLGVQRPLELRTLCLSFNKVREECCKLIAERCPKLKELDLGMSWVDDDALDALKSLDVEKLELYSNDITEKSVPVFADHFKRLRQLNVSSCENLPYDALAVLRQRRPSLSLDPPSEFGMADRLWLKQCCAVAGVSLPC